jgi:translation initiation factor 4E
MSTQYLTLNSKLYDIESLVIPEQPTEGSSPLRNKWSLWVQLDSDSRKQGTEYKDSTKCLVSFDTIDSFWGVFNHVPQPSQFMDGPPMTIKGMTTPINSLMIFRDGVRPEWEDPANCEGGHFHYHWKPTGVAPGQMDEFWNNLVLAVVGNTIESDGEFSTTPIIQGVRFVDKRNGTGKQAGIRVEIWFSKPIDPRHLQKVKSRIEKAMVLHLDGTCAEAPRCQVKYHASLA